MRPFRYKIVSIRDVNPNVLTEFVNNMLTQLNENDTPVINDLETHWELDSQFAHFNGDVFFVFALWTSNRY